MSNIQGNKYQESQSFWTENNQDNSKKVYHVYLSRYTDKKWSLFEENHPELLFNRFESPSELFFGKRHLISCQLTKSPFLRPINAKKYAIRVGVPIFTTPHTLRHSYATDLLSQGVDLRIIQEFLGHRSITSTQIYTHVTNKRLRDIHRQFHRGKNLKG